MCVACLGHTFGDSVPCPLTHGYLSLLAGEVIDNILQSIGCKVSENAKLANQITGLNMVLLNMQ